MIDLNKHFDAVKSIVCLSGEIPGKDFFMRKPHLPLIATDGAGSTLISRSIIPNLIVGDLDSLDQSIVPPQVEVIQITEQTTTDFEKALQIIEQRGLFPCLVYGATGKESDHTLYNLQVIAKYSQQHTIIFHDSAFKDQEKYGLFVADQLTGNLKIGVNISLFAFTPTIISSQGLKWELDNFVLSSLQSSSRNAIQAPTIKLTVHSGNALVLFDFTPI